MEYLAQNARTYQLYTNTAKRYYDNEYGLQCRSSGILGQLNITKIHLQQRWGVASLVFHANGIQDLSKYVHSIVYH